jgi:hypothetical protein
VVSSPTRNRLEAQITKIAQRRAAVSTGDVGSEVVVK